MIVRAAVQVHLYTDGRTILLPVHRHCDAYEILHAFGYKTSMYRRDMEGFLTDSDEFLDRAEALQHAIDCGQVDPEAPESWDIIRSGLLFSEDLW